MKMIKKNFFDEKQQQQQQQQQQKCQGNIYKYKVALFTVNTPNRPDVCDKKVSVHEVSF